MALSKKILLGTAAIMLFGLLAIPQSAQAWRTSQSGRSVCSESGQSGVVLQWSFTNTEPNEPKWAMDVVARDSVSGKSSPKVTVNPGETESGVINTGEHKVGKGSIIMDLTWTDGRSGKDTRTVHYDAIDCTPPEAPEFSAFIVCEVVDESAVYILKINQSNDVEAVYDPADGTQMPNGDAVKVTATYADGELQVTETAEAATDCTPPAKIQVCRDEAVITISEDEVLETDTEDLENCTPVEEEEQPEILPVTGPGAAIMGFLGLGGLATATRNWYRSKKQLVGSLLN